jgi:hypothetical protein
LLNRGERLALIAPSGQLLYSVEYNDKSGWPKLADGHGFSLEITDPFGGPSNPANWHASAELNGSPGRANSRPADPIVRINEILTSAESGPDWVELANTTSNSIDLTGWVLREPGNTNRLVFPGGTSLSPGSYLVIPCDKNSGEPVHAPFALDSESETLLLEDSSGAQMDLVVSGPQVPGYSAGWIDGKFVLNAPTPGAANSAANPGSPSTLVINEWLASSGPGESDWVELYNTDPTNAVSLRGLFIGLSDPPFEITSGAFIAPNGFVRLWADEQPGPDHLDFKLPAEGATISLYDSSEHLIDSITYGPQSPGISEGFYPDGTRNLVSFRVSPTPGKPNSLRFPVVSAVQSDRFILRWPSLSGLSYGVDRSDDLSTWTKHADVTATGPSCSSDDSLTSGHKYYRVIALPPPE